MKTVPKRFYVFGAGSLCNDDASVDGYKHIRLPLVRVLDKFGFEMVWVGFTRQNKVKNHHLSTIGLHAPEWLDDVRDVMRDDGSEMTDLALHSDDPEIAARMRNRISKKPGVLLVELRPDLSKAGYAFKKEFDAQLSLIKCFFELNLPVIIWDMDVWSQHLPRWVQERAVLCRAYCEPAEGQFARETELLFGWHRYWPWWENKIAELAKMPKLFDVSYCGNVSNRREEFGSFFEPFHSADMSVCIQGNWLRSKYGDRDFSLDQFPRFMFFGEAGHWSALPTLARSKCTIHFSSAAQRKAGMPTVRIWEAAMGRSLAFCFEGIRHIDRFVPEEFIVSDGQDALERWKRIDTNGSWSDMHELFAKKVKNTEHSYDARARTLIDVIVDHYGIDWKIE